MATLRAAAVRGGRSSRAIGLAASLVACNVITGAGDLGVDTRGSAGDAAGSNAGTPDGGDRATDGGGGGGGDGDGGSQTEPTINPSLAPCGEKAVCLPSTSGWSPAVSLTVGLGSCPGEWPQKLDYMTSGGGGCSCTCKPNAGESCGGAVVTRGGPTCTGSPDTHAHPGDGTCLPLDGASLPVSLTASPSKPPTGCSGTVSSSLGAPRGTAICAGATPLPSNECQTDEVCVPKASIVLGALTCIVHDGEVACPAKLPLRTVLGASVSDGRSCGPTCTCETSGCSGGTVRLFAGADCTTMIRSLKVDGTCTTTGASITNATAYEYDAPSGCKVKDAPALLGAETVTSPRTLCCSFGL